MIEQLTKAMIKFMNTYLPLTCHCGERYSHAHNKKDMCDTCFLDEVVQRVLNNEAEGEPRAVFINWLIENYAGEVDED